MNLKEKDIGCPYCGETITILVDPSIAQQQYIEDCHVCCRPIVIHVHIDVGNALTVEARHEDQ